MINEKSLEAVKAAGWSSEFCKPLYESYCFSRIPGTILNLFGKKSAGLPQDCWVKDVYHSVVLFVVDGFGWQLLEKYHAKYPFLSRFFRQGIVSKLTSQFPSTTAAHITTLCSGSEVGQTGIYEWFYYEPQLDRVIAPLLYSYAGDKKCGTLHNVIAPEKIFPDETLFQKLQKEGIASYIFQPKDIAFSIYSNWMFRGSEVKGYDRFSKSLDSVLRLVERGGLFYVYFGDIDGAGHHHGISSKEFDKAIDECFRALEEFWEKLNQRNLKVATLLTADHGMTPIDPATTVFLNREIPKLESMIKKGADGRLLTPAGSCRDYFLHIDPGKLDEVKALLTKTLGEKALICETAQLIQDGFFGSKEVSKEFLKRVGNLVILPYDNHSIWWYEKDRFDQKFYAMHGGLTRPEMETIFLFHSGTPS
jgi:predicted AlkP superfamily pyrophosphatase or phosphodiesterase